MWLKLRFLNVGWVVWAEIGGCILNCVQSFKDTWLRIFYFPNHYTCARFDLNWVVYKELQAGFANLGVWGTFVAEIG